MNNPTCKKCGLLKSTAYSTGQICSTTSTVSGDRHNFVEEKEECTCQICGKWFPTRKDSPLVEPIEHECIIQNHEGMEEILKEWFEANYLDGDKIQDGQMLSSKECFSALLSRDEEWKKRLMEIVPDKRQFQEINLTFDGTINETEGMTQARQIYNLESSGFNDCRQAIIHNIENL